LDKIEYEGTVWAINHGLPQPLLDHCIKKLVDYGVKKDSLVISWNEGVATYDMKFNIKNAVEIVQKINQYKK